MLSNILIVLVFIIMMSISCYGYVKIVDDGKDTSRILLGVFFAIAMSILTAFIIALIRVLL